MNSLTAANLTDLGKFKLDQGEECVAEFDSIELQFGNKGEMEGCGKLLVTSKRAVWLHSPSEARKLVGFSWDMPLILLHAISRDTESYPKPCIYAQLDCDEPSDLRFAPTSDRIDLQKMYDAFSHAAMLNPDPEEDEEEGDWIYNDSEVTEGAQREMLDNFDSMLQISSSLQPQFVVDGQFDDADDEDVEGTEDDLL